MSSHGLTFGSIDLASGIAEDGGYWFEVLADGFAPGSPQAVKAVIATLMRDGEDERISRYGNRTFTFRVAVRAPDSGALHAGEAALVAELGGRNTISWTPPDGYGGETIFDVLNSTMDPEFDDMALLRSPLEMVYAITATCSPWPRSSTLTTTTFSPTTPTVTTIDDGSSTALWSSNAVSESAVTWLGESAVKFDVAPGASEILFPEWTGTLAVANYLAVDAAVPSSVNLSRLTLGEDATPPLASEWLASGFRRYYFAHPGAVSPRFTATLDDYSSGSGPDLYIGGLYSATSIPAEGVLVAAVGGSVPTTGAVTISRPSNEFSDLMVYSDPAMLSAGFSPALSDTWQYAPQGRYLVYVYRNDVISSVTDIGDGDVVVVTVTAGGRTQEIRTRSSDLQGDWKPVGEVTLGGNRDGRVGTITVTGTLNGAAMTTPQFRLFRMAEDTALLYASPDAGVTEVIVDTPSVDYPHGGVWFNNADGLDNVDAWDFPILVPPATALYVSDTSMTGDMTVTLTHYEHWHTFSASEAS